MTDDLAGKVLEKITQPLVLYLAELGNLMEAQPSERSTFELTAQSKLQVVRSALQQAREKYEVYEQDLTESRVITYGIQALAARYNTLKQVGQSEQDEDIAQNLQRTLEAILSEGPITTLPALLDFARNYKIGT